MHVSCLCNNENLPNKNKIELKAKVSKHFSSYLSEKVSTYLFEANR